MNATRKVSEGLTAQFKAASAGNLGSRAYLNTLASALEYAARVVVIFALTPVLVGRLGGYQYGALQVLSRATGYISTAGGRPSQALKWTIASQQSSTNLEQKRRFVGSALAVWLLFLPLLLVTAGLLVWSAPILLKASPENAGIVRLAAGLLAAEVIVIALVQVPRSVLVGENLGYKRMALTVGMVLTRGGFVAIALYSGAGLLGVVSAYLVASIITGVIILQITRANIPWFGIARPTSSDVRSFTGLSGWFLVWRLISQSLQTGDIILLGILGTLGMVTTYSLTRYASEVVIQLTALAVFSILPGLGGIIGSGNLQRAARIRNEIMLLTWIAIVPMGVTILVWNAAFVQLWVGSEYYAGTLNNLLIVLVALQYTLIRNDGNIIDLTLDLRRKVIIGGLSTVTSIAVAAVLIVTFDLGIFGMLLGLLSGRSIISVAYPWLAGRFLGESLISQLKKTTKPILLTFLFLMGSLVIGTHTTASNWFTFAIGVGLTLAGATLITLYAGLTGDQRERVIRRAAFVMRFGI